MKVIWSPFAKKRVDKIAQYIAKENISAALEWVNAVFEQTERLKDFPESGRYLSETNRKDLKEIIFKKYRIIYRIRKKRIEILTVRHSKQLLPLKEIGVKKEKK